MFDELKEVKYTNEMQGLQLKSEVYLEPKRADVQLGSEQTSEEYEILKIKLGWSKSWWLLQHLAILVNFDFVKL